MDYCLITFRSVTFAQRAQGVLNRAGIGCSVQRTPRWMEEQGCGYSLRLRSRDVKNGISALRDAGVAFRKIYGYTGNGAMEELTL